MADVELAEPPDPDAVELVVGPEVDRGDDAELCEERTVVGVEAVQRVAAVDASPADGAAAGRRVPAEVAEVDRAAERDAAVDHDPPPPSGAVAGPPCSTQRSTKRDCRPG